MMTASNDGWIKATASSGGGDCVEMRAAHDRIQVRDSKLGSGSPIHTLTLSSFAVWLKSAKNGELDHLGR